MNMRGFLSNPLLLAVVLWLCTLPLALILGAQLLGTVKAWTIAGVLLVTFLAVCLYLCRRDVEHPVRVGARR